MGREDVRRRAPRLRAAREPSGRAETDHGKGREDAVPTPSKTELPTISTPRPGDAALSSAPIPYSTSPAVKQRLRPQRSVSLLHGIMNCASASGSRKPAPLGG